MQFLEVSGWSACTEHTDEMSQFRATGVIQGLSNIARMCNLWLRFDGECKV